MFSTSTFVLQVLSDPEKRQFYDATGHSQYSSQAGGGGGGASGSPFTPSQAEEIFRQFFGKDMGFGDIFGQASSGSDVIQLSLNLSFNEAVSGCTKEVSVRVQGVCKRCHGFGAEPGTKERTCPYCRGTGEVSHLTVRFLVPIFFDCGY